MDDGSHWLTKWDDFYRENMASTTMSQDESACEWWIYPPWLDQFHVCIMSNSNDMVELDFLFILINEWNKFHLWNNT
jgi:hypothetical protein